MFSVEYRTAKSEPKRVNCEIDTCSIGKGDDNLIVLRGWTVGKRHATIHLREGSFFVEDHGAMGATEVNGKVIEKEYGPLTSEDVIRIGDNYVNLIMLAEPNATADSPVMPHASAASPGAIGVDAHAQANASTLTATGSPHMASPSVVVQAPILKKVDNKTAEATARMNTARRTLHGKLISQMDLRRVDVRNMSEESLRQSTQSLIAEILNNDSSIAPDIDKARLAKDLLNEVVGLGPLEDLLADPSISEIMVNRFDEIYVERKGRLIKMDIAFSTDHAVLGAIERIVAPIGRRIDESSPMVDARLKDGSRVNAVIPPLALKGCNITIRKFSKNKLIDQDMINYGSATKDMMRFLEIAVEQAANIVISGGTGSGKTTLLNVMSNYIPEDERIVTVEDAAELQLAKPHLISLESRPSNSEVKFAITIR